jgi:hypothetical protein
MEMGVMRDDDVEWDRIIPVPPLLLGCENHIYLQYQEGVLCDDIKCVG